MEWPLNLSLKPCSWPSNCHFSRNLSGTESWWMERKRSADALLECATRSNSPFLDLPWVTSSVVFSKPASVNLCSISFARRRLKSYSYFPRALFAPGTSAVWPTSTATRKLARLQVCPTALAVLPADCAQAGPSSVGASAASASAQMRGQFMRLGSPSQPFLTLPWHVNSAFVRQTASEKRLESSNSGG